ncbi:Asp23/Gls24 family envelope stress response protein [Gordonia sp. VNQ95]|uniref:Asp23/Gls24 family envelope stress response protein n=1 Tax=Gordonia TaxID=2053 RepID=UPI0032B3883A
MAATAAAHDTVTRGSAGKDPRRVGTAAPATADARGSLVIADRVGTKIAGRAALEVDGVIAYSGGLASLLGPGGIGTSYPSARVDMSETAPVVSVAVALSWPCAVAEVCRHVRAHVADELARLTGLRPGQVNVAVAALVPPTTVDERKDGYVALPSVVPSVGGDGDTGDGDTGDGDTGGGDTHETQTRERTVTT